MSSRRGRECNQRRKDARRRLLNERFMSTLPNVGFQEDGSYVSTSDIEKLLNNTTLNSQYEQFDRLYVESDSLRYDHNNYPCVADEYECTCGDWNAGYCSPDFCIKQCTLRRLPHASTVSCSDDAPPHLKRNYDWKDNIASMSYEEFKRHVATQRRSQSQKRSASTHEVADHDEPVEKVPQLSLPELVVSPPFEHERSVEPVHIAPQKPSKTVVLSNTTMVAIPKPEIRSTELQGISDMLIGEDVQFIYSGPGCGKTTLKKQNPWLLDTDETFILPGGSIVLTNRWELLVKYPKSYHIVHLPSRAVWDERCKSKCKHWSPTWYDDLSKLKFFFKMRSDHFLSDLVSFVDGTIG